MNFMFSWQEQYLLPLEHKIHIFSPPCNILYLSHVVLLGIEFLSVAYVLTVFCCDNWYVCFYPTWCCWVSSFTVLLTCLHFSTVTIDVFTFVPRDFSWPSSVAEISTAGSRYRSGTRSPYSQMADTREKARRWRINKNCKWKLSVNLQSV